MRIRGPCPGRWQRDVQRRDACAAGVVGRSRSQAAEGKDGRTPANARFRIASQTKQMVATVVLQLVEEGRLGVDDKLGDLLPVVEKDLVERGRRGHGTADAPVHLRHSRLILQAESGREQGGNLAELATAPHAAPADALAVALRKNAAISGDTEHPYALPDDHRRGPGRGPLTRPGPPPPRRSPEALIAAHRGAALAHRPGGELVPAPRPAHRHLGHQRARLAPPAAERFHCHSYVCVHDSFR
ncbi:serine hydrolase [Actinomadura sp. NPDC048955]|uniref:serine hydrolase n=1 Tax=Actinomadura sp. NPDC048955 TaxID=3158228 RepID=UPI0033E19D3A